MKLEQFKVDVPQAALDDLHERLARARFPEQIPDAAWDYGTELEYLRDFVAYWRDEYDWRATEQRLNNFEQLTTEIDGANVHFIHARSPEPDALPIVLTHGWPGSVVEFLDCIGPLSDPVAHGGDAADAFHVVVPSLPGYAFSGPTRERGWHPGRVGKAWAELMAGLGYSRYVAQGGDWGSFVTTQLALADPDHCAGVHVNMLAPIPMTEDHTPEEDDCLAGMASYNEHDSGYFKEQSTKPQTIGYALDDSPVGLAAWIVEKFRTWSDCEGDVERSFTKDQLIDNLMLYWLTTTAHSAARMYYEFDKGLKGGSLDLFSKLTQPVGYARYPKEIMRTSRRWAEAQHQISHFADMPRGGHFAAFEVPDLFIPDVREWARTRR
ncbi:MAG: epoxide hydrolase [Actinobacteria bacterium]|nr:epoxide hydrolase [Actinomycetota bacterium]